jgi:hypothetical protein
MMLNKVFFLIIVFQLYFFIIFLKEGPIKAKGIGTGRSQVSDLC